MTLGHSRSMVSESIEVPVDVEWYTGSMASCADLGVVAGSDTWLTPVLVTSWRRWQAIRLQEVRCEAQGPNLVAAQVLDRIEMTSRSIQPGTRLTISYRVYSGEGRSGGSSPLFMRPYGSSHSHILCLGHPFRSNNCARTE